MPNSLDGEARRRIFSVEAVATATTAVTGIVLHDLPVMTPALIVAYAFVGLYLVGRASASERVHQGIVLANAVMIVVGYAPLIYSPLSN